MDEESERAIDVVVVGYTEVVTRLLDGDVESVVAKYIISERIRDDRDCCASSTQRNTCLKIRGGAGKCVAWRRFWYIKTT